MAICMDNIIFLLGKLVFINTSFKTVDWIEETYYFSKKKIKRQNLAALTCLKYINSGKSNSKIA